MTILGIIPARGGSKGNSEEKHQTSLWAAPDRLDH